MNKNFLNSVKMTAPGKNVFDLSHDVKMSLNIGELVPIMVQECIPGDKFSISCESLLRFAPLVNPVMHRLNVTMHYFFVPNRLLWEHWEDFITSTKVAGVIPAPPFVTINKAGSNYTRLMDYLGVPPPDAALEQDQNDENISALPLAAYQKIWNDYYRDQNLQTDVTDSIALIDGDNTANILNLSPLRDRAYEKDIYTGALPFQQKGDPVGIPIGPFPDVPVNIDDASTGTSVVFTGVLNPGGTSEIGVAQNDPAVAGSDVNPSEFYAKTSLLQSTIATINDLRSAIKLQEWYEKAARAGSRYFENILAFFGVKSPDSRLQRPEYITGTKSPVVISEVLSTAQTDDLPQANMAGHAISITSGEYGNYFCQEHGFIIGIMSVLPRTAYQQGLEKHWLKLASPMEYYWPQFAHLGEVPISYREIFAYGPSPAQDFGFLPIHYDYRIKTSRVAGDFRTTLASWHLGRIFSTQPQLTEDFIRCQAINNDRIFAVIDPDVQKLYAHVLNKVRAVRPIPKFGTPTF